ncbi:MAG TPA: BON domain-containing protein [Burkholderiaceae bacterium]|nr:BON domain-containing protein [Burkholderiaceae bacterium]
MVISRFRNIVVLAVACLALGACAGDPTPPATAQVTDDTAITKNVETAVIGVPGIHADKVGVTTSNGNVTLSGAADNETAALNAVEAARQISGVKKVDYDIRIAQP